MECNYISSVCAILGKNSAALLINLGLLYNWLVNADIWSTEFDNILDEKINRRQE